MSKSSETSFDPFHEVVDSKHIDFGMAGLRIDLHPSITKFMLVELLAVAIILFVFLPLTRRITTRGEKRGRLWSFAEFLLVFIRDQVAKPGIGEHDYRKFLPFLWTIFLFILLLNLLGMVPFVGSPTASIAVSGTLALVSFLVTHISGIRANHGVGNYLKSFIPHIDTSEGIMKIIGPPILVVIFCIEFMGIFIRGFVLGTRLFANMLAGHTVLFVILYFIKMIGMAGDSGNTVANYLFVPVAGMSILLDTALCVLELFVGCLQAFVFTFLTSVFIGMALHPEH